MLKHIQLHVEDDSVMNDQDRIVAVVYDPQSGADITKDSIALATLFAAAPDLLEVLEQCVAASRVGDLMKLEAALDAAETVIAKAGPNAPTAFHSHTAANRSREFINLLKDVSGIDLSRFHNMLTAAFEDAKAKATKG